MKGWNNLTEEMEEIYNNSLKHRNKDFDDDSRQKDLPCSWIRRSAL